MSSKEEKMIFLVMKDIDEEVESTMNLNEIVETHKIGMDFDSFEALFLY